MPITGKGRGSVREWADGSVLNALKRNLRFGFVAGGLDDRGVYADLFDADQEQYSPGLTGVLATDQTRDGIMSALYNRSCYATSGARIILSFQMAGTEMGQEVSTDDKPGLAFCRHISGHVAGTEDLLKVELIRNGEVIKTFEPKNSYHCDFTYDDMDAVDKIALDAKDGKPPFIFYYVRVTQSDFHVAWSSPIWLDLSEDMVKPAKRTRKKA